VVVVVEQVEQVFLVDLLHLKLEMVDPVFKYK
jgi:hypothetical protein